MTSAEIVFTDTLVEDTASQLLARNITRVVSVSDANTYAVVGRQLVTGLERTGIRVRSIILPGSGLVADAHAIATVLVDMDINSEAIIAVGSGTITDITRFVSHRTGKRFISIPTAPSMDGYTSNGAPLLLQGFKQTVRCCAPEVVIASRRVLSSAPSPMIAAGFADVLGKVTAVADWRLAHLLIDAPFDEAIAEMTTDAYEKVIRDVSGIAERSPDAIERLFSALASTGDAIRRFGASDPASGSEHHISHFLEMEHIARGRKPILHGAKVALGTIVSAGWYGALRGWDLKKIAGMEISLPEYDHDTAEIRVLLGTAGDIILERNSFLSTLTRHQLESIRARLLERWKDVRQIAETVPSPEEIRVLLQRVGGPVRASDLGLSFHELETAARLSHYVRSRFTIKTLMFILGIPQPLLPPTVLTDSR